MHRARPKRRARAVFTRLMSAFLRGAAVALMIATPAMMLPGVGRDTAEIVILIALLSALLTTDEYAATYPSIVEFRDAPPFNRIRFLSLFLTVVLLSVVCRGKAEPTSLTIFVEAVGALVGQVMDFPYSPVRLMVLMLPETASPEYVSLVRSAAGLAYLISLLSLAVFVLFIRRGLWPAPSRGFNVWVNLPTFDPTAGGDVVDRLNRDARVNLALGLVLPFLIPAVAKAGAILFSPVMLTSDHTLIWTVAAWAFLPASLFMRGIALGRVADLIVERRRRGEDVAVGMIFV